MSLGYCPECGTKISSLANVCPYCGYAGDGKNALAVLDKTAIQSTMWKDASLSSEYDWVFPISGDRRERYEDLFRDAESLLMIAPALYEEIKAMIPDSIVAARIPGEVQRQLDEGVLRFVADKNGEILPTIFKDNKMYKQVRLEELNLTPNLGNAVINLQQQLALAEIIHEVREVHEEIRGLRESMKNDKLARLDAAWYQLQQAAKMNDARLREAKLLGISDTAAELRFMLERDFAANRKFFDDRSGNRNIFQILFDTKALEEGEQRSREVFDTLLALTRAVQVETSAYCLLDEQDAAQTSLKQFSSFMALNGLDDKNNLLELSQFNSEDQNGIIDGFISMQEKIECLPSLSDSEMNLLPSETTQEVDEDEEM